MTEKKSAKAVFDFCKTYVKSINDRISKDPELEITKEELAPLTENFEFIIEFTKAFLIRANDPLYGTIFLTMNSEVDYSTRALLDLDFNGIDFTLKMNPLFIGNLSFFKFITLVVGEILRIIFDHMSSYAQLNPTKETAKHENLERAANAALGTMIASDIKLVRDSYQELVTMSIPDDFYTTTDITAETDVRVKPKEPLEYYFKILEKFKKRDSANGSKLNMDFQMNGSGGQDNEPSDGQQNQNGNSSVSPNMPSKQDAENHKKEVASPNNSKGNVHHNWESNDPEKVKERTKSVVSDALDNLTAKQRGEIPSSIMQQIELMLAPPEISWKQILRKFVGTIPTPYRRTRRRLNRLQPYRMDLCGRLPKRRIRVVVCIDTSGSMSNDDIEYCMGEIFNIVKEAESEVTVIECDAEVNRVYVAKKPKEVKPEVCGRGGTLFTPAIEYINKDGKYRDALMIYFTDGYGESRIPKPRTFRNLWVVLKDEKALSLEEPYGEVKSLAMDKDYQKFKKRS